MTNLSREERIKVLLSRALSYADNINYADREQVVRSSIDEILVLLDEQEGSFKQEFQCRSIGGCKCKSIVDDGSYYLK